MNDIKERNSNMDLLRIFAAFCVISVHFFLNTGFYDMTIENAEHYFFIVMRTFFMICVPLFILLTGFFMNKKFLSLKYYKGILRVLGVYLATSILCGLFIKFVVAPDNNKEFSYLDIISGIFSYKSAPYSWYIEMYIGLFLIIPFLNIIYNNLKTKKEKLILIGIFMANSTLPNVINDYYKIFPSYLQSLWPITYYFIGAYLSEYKVKLKKIDTFLLIIVCLLVFAGINFGMSAGDTFKIVYFNDWQGYQNLITSVLVFIFFMNIKTNNTPSPIKKILKVMSGLTLHCFLLAYIFDYIYYEILTIDKNMWSKGEILLVLKEYILSVPFIFLFSMLSGFIMETAKNIVKKLWKRGRS